MKCRLCGGNELRECSVVPEPPSREVINRYSCEK